MKIVWVYVFLLVVVQGKEDKAGERQSWGVPGSLQRNKIFYSRV